MPKPIVFISSSVADAAFADRLTAALERAAAIVIRAPAGSTPAGPPPEVEQALTDADACVVVLSAAAIASERVEREAARFHELRTRQPQRLLVPVLLASADPAVVWPFLLGYTLLSASNSGARDDEALIAEVLRRLDLLLEVDTVVVPAILTSGAVPAGLDLAKVPPHVVVEGDVEAQDTAVLPASGTAIARAASVYGENCRAVDVHSRRFAMWRPTTRRKGILVMAGGLLALALCVTLSVGFLARGDHSGDHAGSYPTGASSTDTAGQTPSLAPTATSTGLATATAAPNPTNTQGAGTPTASVPLVTQPGLLGDYYQSTRASIGSPAPTYPAQGSFLFEEMDPNVNYTTDAKHDPYGSPFTSKLPPDTPYAVKWHGFLQVPTSGIYTFYTYSDDGISVVVNAKQLIYDWTTHMPTWDCSTNGSGCNTITLEAGQLYPIELDYYENGQTGATIQLCWQAANLQHNIIPPSAFSH